MIVLIESEKGGRTHVYSQVDLDRHLAQGWRVVVEEVKLVDNVIPIEKKQRGRPKR